MVLGDKSPAIVRRDCVEEDAPVKSIQEELCTSAGRESEEE